MTIDGTNSLAYGLVPISVEGAFNMPPRYGAWYYDWGDEVELLWNDKDFNFDSRIITATFLYDPKRQTSGVPSATYIDGLLQGFPNTEIPIVLSDAVGTMGQHTVTILTCNHKKYKGLYQKVTITFHERVPAFNGTAPLSKSGGSLAIDGYSFSQFSLVLQRVRALSSISQLNQSKETQYNSPAKKSPYRGKSSFFIDAYIKGSTSNDAVTKLHSLQKVLTKQDVMDLNYGGATYSVACIKGLTAQKRSENVFKVMINLIRV